jgi:hypothetical protein
MTFMSVCAIYGNHPQAALTQINTPRLVARYCVCTLTSLLTPVTSYVGVFFIERAASD